MSQRKHIDINKYFKISKINVRIESDIKFLNGKKAVLHIIDDMEKIKTPRPPRGPSLRSIVMSLQNTVVDLQNIVVDGFKSVNARIDNLVKVNSLKE